MEEQNFYDEDAIRLARRMHELRYGRSARGPGEGTFLPGVMGRGALQMLSGAGKGATAAFVGGPGDLESLARGVAGSATSPEGILRGAMSGLEEDTALPSSKSVEARLTKMGWHPEGGAGALGETVGGFSPLSMSGPLKYLLKLRKARAARKAAENVVTAEELAPGFFKGGQVPEWDDLEDQLDKAYISLPLDVEKAK